MLLSFRLLAPPLLVFSFTMGAAHAQSAAPVAPASAPATEPRSAAMDAELFYEVFLGELSLQAGDLGASYSLLLEAARASRDEALFQRATDIALQSRSGESALAAARAWALTWPQSQTAQRYLLQILLILNRAAESAPALQQLLGVSTPEARREVILSLPPMYQRASDKAAASAVVHQALAPYLADADLATPARISMGRMQLFAGQTQDAMATAQQIFTQSPVADEAAVFAMELLEAKVAGAEALVQKALATRRPPAVHMNYVRVLLDLQRYAEAQAELATLTKDHPDLAPPWLAQSVLQLQSGEVDQAEASLARYLQAPGGTADTPEMRAASTQVALIRSEIAEKRGQFDQAEQWLAGAEDAATRFDVQVRRAALLARQGRLAHARALLQSLPASTPQEEQRKLAAQVQLLREAGEYAQAYALATQLAEASPDNPDLAYDQAMLAEKTGDLATMERLLRKIIAAKPDYHHAYNALGYSFAERGIHLAEARSLIEAALRLAPGDPFITDSLGWVEFRAGNTGRARELLASAYAMRKDADIAAHYGEVLWVSGERDAAKIVWREAQRSNADNATLRETLKRLGVQL